MTTATFSTAPTTSMTETKPHVTGMGRLIALHLLPGLIVVTVYALLAWLVRPLGWPSLLPMLLAIPVGLLPAELGFLLYQGKRQHGYLTLKGVIAYNQPLSFKEYAIWVPVILTATMALFILFGVADGILMQKLFF